MAVTGQQAAGMALIVEAFSRFPALYLFFAEMAMSDEQDLSTDERSNLVCQMVSHMGEACQWMAVLSDAVIEEHAKQNAENQEKP